jgi:hypothetical protein
VWIAPAEHLVDGIECRYRVVRMTAGKAPGEAVIAGCRIVENCSFGNAFVHDSNFTARWEECQRCARLLQAPRDTLSHPRPIETYPDQPEAGIEQYGEQGARDIEETTRWFFSKE